MGVLDVSVANSPTIVSDSTGSIIIIIWHTSNRFNHEASSRVHLSLGCASVVCKAAQYLHLHINLHILFAGCR
jgi:hypothetical protein